MASFKHCCRLIPPETNDAAVHVGDREKGSYDGIQDPSLWLIASGVHIRLLGPLAVNKCAAICVSQAFHIGVISDWP